MSNSVTPWMIAHQAPLSIEFFRPRILAWVFISFSMGPSPPRDRTHISHIASEFFTVKNCESLYCTPITHIILYLTIIYLNYSSILKRVKTHIILYLTILYLNYSSILKRVKKRERRTDDIKTKGGETTLVV